MSLNAFFFETPIDSMYLGHQVAEIFKDRIYEKYLAGKKDLVILDIGANVGVASYYFSRFASVVHAFEPAAAHYTVFSHMLLFNGIKNVIPHQMAVANEDGEADLFHSINRTMHSINPAKDQSLLDKENPKEKVKTTRLDTFFKKYDITHVDFMKLDVEGLEDEILCGEGFANIADKIDTIVIEIHGWINRNPNQIRDALTIAGFELEVVPNDAQILVARRK